MKKFNLRKSFADTFELPQELVCDTTKISLTGFTEFEVLNYKSLVEYESNMIRINTKEKLIKIEGENLIIKAVTDDEISIAGEIKSVVFD